jgi:hypothetical protein
MQLQNESAEKDDKTWFLSYFRNKTFLVQTFSCFH